MKNNTEAFQEGKDMLFGPRYEEVMSKTLQSKQKSKELFKTLDEPPRIMVSRRPQQPFQRSPLSQRGRGGVDSLAGWDQESSQTEDEEGTVNLVFNSHLELPFLNIVNLLSMKEFHRNSTEFHRNSESSPCRQAQIFYKKLAKIDQGSIHFTGSPRLQDSFPFSPKTIKTTKTFETKGGGSDNSGSGDRNYVEKRGNKNSFLIERSDFKSSFSSQQERWREPSCNKLKGTEQIHSIPAFQNGRSVSSEGNVDQKRFHVQVRSKRCIFFSPFGRKLTKICSVPLPLFRTSSSTPVIHKDNESTHCSVTMFECKGDSVPRRYASDSRFYGGNTSSKGHIDLHTSEVRFFNQCEEISLESNTDFRVSRAGDQFTGNDLIFASREGKEVDCPVSGIVRETLSFVKNVVPSYRQDVFYGSRSATCSSSVSLSTTTTNSGTFHSS